MQRRQPLLHFLLSIIIFSGILSPCSNCQAQSFGGNPSNLGWKQINTDSARIIFPVGMDSAAQRVASIVHWLAANRPVSIGPDLRKINIVLQNQTTIANGYVGLGPFRSEFFLTPEMNNFQEGSIPWGDQLAVHEYRHVMQYNNFHHGLSQLMYSLFGEDGYTLAINASIPDWFFEGDAVYQETITTQQGRGRLPLFLNAYPSLWKAGKNYSWMKMRNGSLKDYVPNHYYIGYLLVNYGRQTYGADFWTKVTRDASAFKGLFYPFQNAIKKHTGLDYRIFRERAIASYKSITHDDPSWNSNPNASIKDIAGKDEKHFANYLFPYSIGKDSLVYLKTSFRARPAFYLNDKDGEHRVKARDISIDEQYSYRNGKIVYSAYESDPRWGWRDYGVIKILDLHTHQQQSLTHKTKYFTPDISPDGTRIAAVQVTTDGKSELHILDASNGKLVSAIRSSDISLFTDPKFIDDQSLVTAVRLKDGKMALALADAQVGSTVRLTPPSFNIVGYPSIDKDRIFFTASFGGNDDVFMLRLSDKKIFRITQGPFGNYFVNAAQGVITWSAFTAEGYRLRQIDEKDIQWKEISEADMENLNPRFSLGRPAGLTPAEYSNILQGNASSRQFAESKYKKGTGLLNFHSWRPYYSDPIFTFSVYGENVLNTLESELYYLYNQDEKTSSVGFNTVYGGWFPFLHFGTEYTFDRTIPIGNRIRHWDQLDTHVGFSIPLNWASGQTFKSFTIGSFYVLRNEYNKGFYKDSLGATTFSYLQHFASWSQQLQRAVQQIYPRFGYAVSLTHRHAISKYTGYQFIGSAAVNLPGFLPNHTIRLTGAFQQRDTLNPGLFSNQFPYSRGYIGRYFSRMWRLSGNYHFPLLLPDWGFANIFYLQRVRANAFYDFTKIYSRDKKTTRDQRSVGGEIYIDTKWWNQYPLTFGFRISKLLDQDQFDGFKGTIFEFILPVSIIPK